MKIASLATPLFVKLAAVVGGLMIVAIGVLSWQLAGALSTLSERDREIGGLQTSILFQNAAILSWQAHGVAAQARADAAVAEALRVNDRQQPVIVSLRESAQRVRNDGQRCEISPELRAAEGL